MDIVLSAGKSRKNVDAYIIIPPDVKEAMELMQKTRKLVQVPQTNKYFFARLNAETPLDGDELATLTKADDCPHLQHPERIRARLLRTYIGTVSQVNFMMLIIPFIIYLHAVHLQTLYRVSQKMVPSF